MTAHRVRLAAMTVVLGLGCGREISSRVVAPRLEDVNGTFAYRAYDGSGRLLLVGMVTLNAAQDSTVTGAWAIRWAPGADTTTTVGPQVGTGMLGGRYGGERTTIDLNPAWADNNVYLLAGVVAEGDITGQWQHSTLIGPVAEGTFELRRLAN